jgi:DTW domain-containing protein YfiP
VVLRHAKEAHKSTNTARLAALALPGLVIVPWGARGQVWDPAALAAPGTCLLFPGAADEAPAGVPATLVVLDGTWAQARRMTHRIPGLAALPRLALPTPEPTVQRLRASPHAVGMATLEAIAVALGQLEGPRVQAELTALHARYVAAVRSARGYRASATV